MKQTEGELALGDFHNVSKQDICALAVSQPTVSAEHQTYACLLACNRLWRSSQRTPITIAQVELTVMTKNQSITGRTSKLMYQGKNGNENL